MIGWVPIKQIILERKAKGGAKNASMRVHVSSTEFVGQAIKKLPDDARLPFTSLGIPKRLPYSWKHVAAGTTFSSMDLSSVRFLAIRRKPCVSLPLSTYP